MATGHGPIGRLQSLAHDFAGTSSDHNLGLTYNPAGQIRSRSGSNDSYAWTGAYAVNRPYSVNGQNQYTAAGGATFAYDANGNLTSDGSTTFVYDVENRLVSASGAKTASLVYDPLGRLFQTSGDSAGITQFLYDDDALIGEYTSGGYMTRRYIHGTGKGVDDPLIWYENAASGWRRALVADQQGSVIAVADMHGNPLATNAYDEYGIPDARNQGRFQYTGQAWLPELGMYHYKARIYSPTLGRFLQVDPIGYDDGGESADLGKNFGRYGNCSFIPSCCAMLPGAAGLGRSSAGRPNLGPGGIYICAISASPLRRPFCSAPPRRRRSPKATTRVTPPPPPRPSRATAISGSTSPPWTGR